MLSKVIIEAALLTDEEKIAACTIAKAAGADYVKTSTGFGPGGATVADVTLMRRVVGPDIGVKAAGGVRDFEAVKALVAAGAAMRGAWIGSALGVIASAATVDAAAGVVGCSPSVVTGCDTRRSSAFTR